MPTPGGRARDVAFRIRPEVGVGVEVVSEAGVGVGVGTEPPRLRNPGLCTIALWSEEMKAKIMIGMV